MLRKFMLLLLLLGVSSLAGCGGANNEAVVTSGDAEPDPVAIPEAEREADDEAVGLDPNRPE